MWNSSTCCSKEGQHKLRSAANPAWQQWLRRDGALNWFSFYFHPCPYRTQKPVPSWVKRVLSCACLVSTRSH